MKTFRSVEEVKPENVAPEKLFFERSCEANLLVSQRITEKENFGKVR